MQVYSKRVSQLCFTTHTISLLNNYKYFNFQTHGYGHILEFGQSDPIDGTKTKQLNSKGCIGKFCGGKMTDL